MQHKSFTSGCRGFTLIEFAIVLVVIAILGAVAFSGLSEWIPNYNLKAASHELYGAIQHAKSVAVARNRNVGIEFTTVGCPPEGGGYILFVDDGAGGGTASDDTRNGSEEIFYTGALTDGVCLTSTTFTANRGGFTARGVATTTNGPGTITLGHSEIGKTYTIEQLLSGAVRIN